MGETCPKAEQSQAGVGTRSLQQPLKVLAWHALVCAGKHEEA